MPELPSNPYHPTAEYGTNLARHEGYWRDGDKLVVRRRKHNLPDRCVLCNEPAEGRRFRAKLVDRNRVISAPMESTAFVRIGLCRRHFRGRRFVPFLRWLAVLPRPVAGAIAFALTAIITRFQHLPDDFLWMGGMMLVWLVANMYIMSAEAVPLAAALTNRSFVWIDGVSLTYLAEAPEIPQPSDGSQDEAAS
jgi:hypothetical protein